MRGWGVRRCTCYYLTPPPRLNTLERASIYEQTWSESWVDELDGEESFGESLDTDPPSKGREKRGKGY